MILTFIFFEFLIPLDDQLDSLGRFDELADSSVMVVQTLVPLQKVGFLDFGDFLATD